MYATVLNTTEDCLRSCEEIATMCYSALYNPGTGRCEVYSRSSTYSYKAVSGDGNNTQTFMSICSTGRFLPYTLSI